MGYVEARVTGSGSAALGITGKILLIQFSPRRYELMLIALSPLLELIALEMVKACDDYE